MTVHWQLTAATSWIPPESQVPSSLAVDPALDCRGADWRGLNPADANLSGARLCRVDLRGTDLSGCQLDGADLRLALYDKRTIWPEDFDYRNSGAIGPEARLSGMFLNSADLAGMDLQGATMMGTYLSGADLSGCCLRGVRIAGADLRHSLLRGTCMEGIRLSGCQLDYADFRGASLTNTELVAVESIRGADFTGTSGLDPMRAALLSRPIQELDCWNPLTRRTTRDSLSG